jgi:hypothetical protein
VAWLKKALKLNPCPVRLSFNALSGSLPEFILLHQGRHSGMMRRSA